MSRPTRVAFCAAFLVLPGLLSPARLNAQVLVGDPRATLETALAEVDRAQQLQKDQPAAARKRFLSAAAQIEAVIENGARNGKIEYNLGNCYLRAGRIGEAVLHYRRAQQFIPRDPLLAENLKEARTRRITSIAPRGRNALLRGLLFIHYDTSVAMRTKTAIVGYIAFWLVLCVRVFLRHPSITAMLIALGMVTASLGASAVVTDFSRRNHPDGVVINMDVVAYKGPGTTYQRRFEQPLQPGVEFTTQARRGDWLNIELPDGKTGWIETSVAQLIPVVAPALGR